jgi:hypothetical protein
MRVEILDSDVVWRDLDGEVVILNLATGNYYGLEGAANAMWQLLVEHGSTEKVIEIMTREYDVDVARLQQDLDALVQDLVRRSILQIEAGKS